MPEPEASLSTPAGILALRALSTMCTLLVIAGCQERTGVTSNGACSSNSQSAMLDDGDPCTVDICQTGGDVQHNPPPWAGCKSAVSASVSSCMDLTEAPAVSRLKQCSDELLEGARVVGDTDEIDVLWRDFSNCACGSFPSNVGVQQQAIRLLESDACKQTEMRACKDKARESTIASEAGCLLTYSIALQRNPASFIAVTQAYLGCIAALLAKELAVDWDCFQKALCADDQVCCNETCLVESNANCGACGTACAAAGAVCSHGTCYDVCNGTLVNLSIDSNHCGACGVACKEGERCYTGACGCDTPGTHCQAGRHCEQVPGFGDHICVCSSPDDVECNGTCTNQNTDSRNCGGCGHACAEYEICVDGSCKCPSECPAGSVLEAGSCTCGCESGRTLCNGACVDECGSTEVLNDVDCSCLPLNPPGLSATCGPTPCDQSHPCPSGMLCSALRTCVPRTDAGLCAYWFDKEACVSNLCVHDKHFCGFMSQVTAAGEQVRTSPFGGSAVPCRKDVECQPAAVQSSATCTPHLSERCGPNGCGDGVDDDNDGCKDNGCTLTVGSCRCLMRSCDDPIERRCGTALLSRPTARCMPEHKFDCRDDDCDGRVDEGLTPGSCYDGPDSTEDVGACRRGMLACVHSMLTCTNQVLPTSVEVCGNQIDDDCNGQTDDGCGSPQSGP